MAFIILLTVLLITFYYWKYRRFFWLASKIPGPFGLPILGISYKFLFGNGLYRISVGPMNVILTENNFDLF